MSVKVSTYTILLLSRSMVEDAHEVISISDVSCPLRDSDIWYFGKLGECNGKNS
jgi:hypothetical protein